jgi:hypothetical protein
MSRHGTCANVIGRRALLATLRFAPDNALLISCAPIQARVRLREPVSSTGAVTSNEPACQLHELVMQPPPRVD